MFGKKKQVAAAKPQPKPNAAVYLVKEINRLNRSDNYMYVYGMLCFAFDFQLITYEERQALGQKLKERASELAAEEKAKR